MRIACECGEILRDSTDYLADKGHLIPDQEWFATFDAVDAEVINPLAAGTLDPQTAHRRARSAIQRHARLIYQCAACGRLHVAAASGELHCFVPASPSTPKELFRSRKREA